MIPPALPILSATAAIPLILFLFAFSFTVFAIQSGDVLMYLALARDYLFKWDFYNLNDIYLYSLKSAELVWLHEYLSYGLFWLAHAAAGFAGLTLLKSALLSLGFALALASEPRAKNGTWPWLILWVLAVLAASFRFIERSSLISDLACLAVVKWLLENAQVSRSLVIRLSALFFLWVQFHAGFPLGLLFLALWAFWHFSFTPEFRAWKSAWLALPCAVLFLNPLGAQGVLYPFHFALFESQILKQFNFEWFPAHHPAFRWSPEVCAFWSLSLICAGLVIRERAWRDLRAWFAALAFLSAWHAVRFVPWASFAMIMCVKPWCELRFARPPRWAYGLALALILAIGVKNLAFGYHSSSGDRRPGFGLDDRYFPIKTLEFLRQNHISGRVYNSHEFGAYLIWQGFYPVFHHGFVTNMNFYQTDVVGSFQSPERFTELARKYGWTMIIVDKLVTYPLVYRVLSPLPNWKIVSEDAGSYLIYYLPESSRIPPSEAN